MLRNIKFEDIRKYIGKIDVYQLRIRRAHFTCSSKIEFLA